MKILFKDTEIESHCKSIRNNIPIIISFYILKYKNNDITKNIFVKPIARSQGRDINPLGHGSRNIESISSVLFLEFFNPNTKMNSLITRWECVNLLGYPLCMMNF